MQHNRILDALKSPNATLAVLGLALIAQMPHAADVFRLIVQGAGWSATMHSYTFAIALELAVLLFVVQNRSAESYGFAAVSIAMNLSYYHLHNVQLFNVAALPALLVSVALPVAIARYSHAVAVAPVHTEPVQDEQALQPVVQPASVQSAETSTQEDKPDAQAKPAQVNPDDARRARLLKSEGLTNIQIAAELGVHRNTVGSLLKRTNGHKEPAQ